MSEIKVGDLVMVVRGCALKHIGKIDTVTEISGGYFSCGCGCTKGDFLTARIPNIGSDANNPKRGWVPPSWLRRIDPLQEPETIERETETT